MDKLSVIVDPYWRSLDELFAKSTYDTIQENFNVVWARDEPMPAVDLQDAMTDAHILISASPVINAITLKDAPKLHTVIEVAGSFPDTIDYPLCVDRGVQILSCAPGFRSAVAEMGLAMALSCARGLFTEHELFRQNREHWLQDNVNTDFTLHRQKIGFIGFGQIARELTRLLSPFEPQVKVYDPWLAAHELDDNRAGLCDLDELMRHARCLFVTAAPTHENLGLLSAKALSMLADHSVVILLSRAHLVDFDALIAEAVAGRLRVATDVFPTEPLAPDHTLRQAPNALLSPHRAAAVRGGRHLIGDLILHDLMAIKAGQQMRRLAVARPDTIQKLAGAGDASKQAHLEKGRIV